MTVVVTPQAAVRVGAGSPRTATAGLGGAGRGEALGVNGLAGFWCGRPLSECGVLRRRVKGAPASRRFAIPLRSTLDPPPEHAFSHSEGGPGGRVHAGAPSCAGVGEASAGPWVGARSLHGVPHLVSAAGRRRGVRLHAPLVIAGGGGGRGPVAPLGGRFDVSELLTSGRCLLSHTTQHLSHLGSRRLR